MKTSAHFAAQVLAGLMVLVGAGFPSPLASQEVHPTFVTIPESFVDLDARVVILREPGRDVVVLNPDEATVETLGVGLLVLRRLRRERTRPLSAGQMVPVTGFALTRELSAANRARLESTLARLRERPLSTIGNLGRGRWIRFGDR